MQLFNRRTALGLSLISLASAGSSAASALPLRAPGPSLPGPMPTRSSSSSVPSPLGKVASSSQGLALSLSFSGQRTATLSNQERTRDLTTSSVPTSLLLANTGSESIKAGTVIEVRSVVLDAAGLLTTSRQPLLVTGASNNVRSYLTFRQTAQASCLTLSQPLAAGQSLKVDLNLALASSGLPAQLPKIQLLARSILNGGAQGYLEAQSAELLLNKI